MSLGMPGRLPSVLQEHKDMADAISAGNADLAHELAQKHIENAEHVFMEWIREQKRS